MQNKFFIFILNLTLFFFISVNSFAESIITSWEDSTTNSAGTDTIVGDQSGTEFKSAQSFKVPFNILCTAASWEMDLKNNTPIDEITLRIETDSSGSPSGTLVDVNATINIVGVADTSFNKGTFSASFPLGSDVLYWLVCLTVPQANDEFWLGKNNVSGYVNGTTKRNNGGGWVPVNQDQNFRIFKDDAVSQVSSGISGSGTGPMIL